MPLKPNQQDFEVTTAEKKNREVHICTSILQRKNSTKPESISSIIAFSNF